VPWRSCRLSTTGVGAESDYRQGGGGVRKRIMYARGEGTLLSEEELPADFLGVFRTRHRVPLGARICRRRRRRRRRASKVEVGKETGKRGVGGDRCKKVGYHKRHG
jgi:hypothetical protein